MKLKKEKVITFTIGFVAYASKYFYRLIWPTSNAFIRYNLPDITDIISEYFLLRTFFIDKPNKWIVIMLVSIYTALEGLQYFGILGNFDAKDIPCYVAGGIIAYFLDRFIYKKMH